MDGHSLRYSVYKFYGLASTTKKATNPSFQRTTFSKINELTDQHGMLNVVKRLAEIKEAHSQERTRVVNGREPIVYHIQKTIGGRGSLETARLLGVDEMSHTFPQPLNNEIL